MNPQRGRTARKKFPDELLGTKRWNTESIHGPRSLLPVAGASSEFPIFLSSFFSPCHAGADGVRRASPPRQWIRHEESSESPFLPAIDAFSFFFTCCWYMMRVMYLLQTKRAIGKHVEQMSCGANCVTLKRTVHSRKLSCAANNF